MYRKVIISLTTIPPRYKNLRLTLDSLLNQTRVPDLIIINIPNDYSRFSKYEKFELNWVDYNTKIHVNSCGIDYGPATKLLGLADSDKFLNLNDEDIIIVVDDDRIYNNTLCETFITEIQNNDNCILTVAGWDINTITQGIIKYSNILFPRGIEYKSGGYINILGGCCGFALTKKLFPDCDANIYNIPECGFFVDDVWLSGFITKMGTNILMIPGGKKCDEQRSINDSIASLFDATRLSKNIECINYFIKKYGIWCN